DYRSIFNQIHRENHWRNAESASGGGSTVAFTESIRTELECWLTRERIASLADIPCGDFNWMRKVRLPDGCRYIGMDIVLDLVERNRARYQDATHRFEEGDLIAGELPNAEAYFCRDVFIHFPNDAIDCSIATIRRTGARFLVVTTFPHIRRKVDTQFPSSRLHNMAFHLGEPVELLKDFGHSRTDKFMGVWRLRE
ncbi:MAG: class I SAM-dependent methyltransferase, partial [Longimicrobiales bacterium]